jgi:hypothetical protein
MENQNCTDVILYECLSIEGFLTKLRGREFAQLQFETLMDAIRQYREIVRDQEQIDRKVASCLYFLEVELISALRYFPQKEEEEKRIQKAYIEISQLTIEVLTPETMIGDLPTELLR